MAAAVSGVLFQHEHPTPAGWIGIAAISVGTLVLVYPALRPGGAPLHEAPPLSPLTDRSRPYPLTAGPVAFFNAPPQLHGASPGGSQSVTPDLSTAPPAAEAIGIYTTRISSL